MVCSPQDGLVILYPDVFRVLEREPRTMKSRDYHCLFTSAFYPSLKIEIIVSLLPLAGLFIFHWVLKVDKLHDLPFHSIAMELNDTEVFYGCLYIYPSTQLTVQELDRWEHTV